MLLRKVMVKDFIETVIKYIDSDLYTVSKELIEENDETSLGLAETCEIITSKLNHNQNTILSFIEKIHENPTAFSFEIYSKYVNAILTNFKTIMTLINMNNGEMNLYSDESISKAITFRSIWFYCFYMHERDNPVDFQNEVENTKVKELLDLLHDEYETIDKLSKSKT